MIEKAMILAAGFGKRLNPLTLTCPKPLLRIGHVTLLSNTLNFLEKFGIKEVVINVHYLGNQVIDYIKKKNFNTRIHIIEEKETILNTGGGILNAIDFFKKDSFLTINPDTLWSLNHIKELELMDKNFERNKKNKCSILVVNKKKSFDKSFKGDFNLKNNLITKNNKEELNYIYTGLQIIKPEAFSQISKKVFSLNEIWDNLIRQNELLGIESKADFFHVSTLSVYNSLLENENLNNFF